MRDLRVQTTLLLFFSEHVTVFELKISAVGEFLNQVFGPDTQGCRETPVYPTLLPGGGPDRGPTGCLFLSTRDIRP